MKAITTITTDVSNKPSSATQGFSTAKAMPTTTLALWPLLKNKPQQKLSSSSSKEFPIHGTSTTFSNSCTNRDGSTSLQFTNPDIAENGASQQTLPKPKKKHTNTNSKMGLISLVSLPLEDPSKLTTPKQPKRPGGRTMKTSHL